MTLDQMTEAVGSAPKYRYLCPEIVGRICREELSRHKKDRDAVKSAKNRLHQAYAAYCSGSRFDEADGILGEYESGGSGDMRELCERIMGLHASSAERIPILGEFCRFVFSAVPSAKTILDLGCGFHPFSLPWIPLPVEHYIAYDIDSRTCALLNRFFRLQGLPETAGTADLLGNIPHTEKRADLAFALKLLPVLEQQRKGAAREFLADLQAEFIVVSYPVKSLGGREKGMAAHYREEFAKLGADTVAERHFQNELVYIIDNR